MTLSKRQDALYNLTRSLLEIAQRGGIEITLDRLQNELQRAATLLPPELGPPEEVDIDIVRRELEVAVATQVRPGRQLSDPHGHEEWLTPDAVRNGTWHYWERYRRWLETAERLPATVVDALDDSTEKVLSQLENPTRDGPWDRRGMVVGHVQSGKTSHYTGLICKAADAGYRFIVVLAGSENNLRSQTQLRIDKGFTGFSFQYEDQTSGIAVGVGLDIVHHDLGMNCLTSVDKDFNAKRASQLGIKPSQDSPPLILVIKKNKSILKNLIQWIQQVMCGPQDDNGLYRTDSCPLLVIDDECDSYSVNTKRTRWEFEKTGEQQDPTAINGQIRQLLHTFERSAFVGYTATPFANIFIYHDPKSKQSWERDQYGPDLFPESFIVSLDRNSQYVGPDRVFGLQESEIQGVAGKQGFPIVREADDISAWIDPKHDRTWVPTDPMPISLRESILAFILVCAARRARGNSADHNSMLIHLSRFVNVQTRIHGVVESELRSMRRSIEAHRPDDPRPIIDELESLWRTDFEPTTAQFASGILEKHEVQELTWEQIALHLLPATDKISVMAINGSSEDVLDYERHRDDGISVIAIGGQKLQRGLTLEGLSVSYFQRSTKMYDTLMQMGRWFGYRPGYIDLCRLYTTTQLRDWYVDIATATEELYGQFDVMAAQGRTPKDFGLKVATSPGLLVTSAVKHRHGERLRLSFAGGQFSVRSLLRADVEHNLELVNEFLASINLPLEADPTDNAFVAHEVSPQRVMDFIESFRSNMVNVRGRSVSEVVQFIKACQDVEQLTHWTVAVPEISDATRVRADFGPIEPRFIERGNHPGGLNDPWVIRTLFTADHEAIGLSASQRQDAIAESEKDSISKTSGAYFRAKREAHNGLLIIYPLKAPKAWELPSEPQRVAVPSFGLSFPGGNSRTPSIEYVVNNIFGSTDPDNPDEEDG